MREAGFEPALPEEHLLKRCVLNHSTIRAKTLKKYTAPYGA